MLLTDNKVYYNLFLAKLYQFCFLFLFCLIKKDQSMAKLNYPRGVIALSSVEMWERFSFYTMQSLLVLYASAKVLSGGLGWSDADALRLVGYYGALVYVSPVIGD